MFGWLTFSALWIFMIMIIAEGECGCSLNCDSYDAVYDFENNALNDYPPSITRWEREAGSGCGTQMVLKLAFSNNKGNNTRLLIDLFFNSPSQWTFNLGDSQTNNGYAGDASTQTRDAELQLLNGKLDGYRSDFGGSGLAFSLATPSKLTRMTLLVSNYQTVWTFNGDPLTVNFYNSPSWFALDGQPDTEGPVNYNLFMGINRVISDFGRAGAGLCKAGLKWVPVY